MRTTPPSIHPEGCEVNPIRFGCLSCPLPFCKYDDPDAYRNWQDRQHRRQVKAAMQAERLTVAQAAQKFGLTERTIYRYKAEEE